MDTNMDNDKDTDMDMDMDAHIDTDMDADIERIWTRTRIPAIDIDICTMSCTMT
jgi:hypothetical protein